MLFNYIFYLFYKLAKKSNSIFSNHFVAIVSILAIQIWFIMSLLNEFYFVTNIRLMPKSITNPPYAIICLGLLIGYNWYHFNYNNKYQKIISKIESNPSKGYIIVAWIMIILVIINYWIISIYLLSLKVIQNRLVSKQKKCILKGNVPSCTYTKLNFI